MPPAKVVHIPLTEEQQALFYKRFVGWRWLVIGTTVLNLSILVAIAGLTRVIWQQQKIFQSQMLESYERIAKLTQEFEQLRVDVVSTSTENTAFLKLLVLKPGIDRGLAREIAHSVTLRAREHKRDPDFVLAIMQVESNFDPYAVSYAGAIGLMQIMPFWKETWAIDRDLKDVDTSINYGLKILGAYEKMYGNMEMALTTYNKGPITVNTDFRLGRNPLNGYAEAIMKAYARIKAMARP